MPVPSNISELSATAASNSPAGTDTIGTTADDYLRAIQAVIVAGLSHKGADIASATTADLGAIAGFLHDITGTTTITGLGTVRAGIHKVVKFEGALTLTHNATSLILPGAANITTADGDIGWFISEGSGNWRCLHYQRKATYPGGFPSGTKMLFQQTAAPTGWTKDTTHNDKSLRVVSGTASSGGATAFTTVFGSGKTTGAKTLATSEIPAHAHQQSVSTEPGSPPGISGGSVQGQAAANLNTQNAGGGGSHDHTLSLDLHYVDVIIATKD
jgi:hypothetical protein